MPGEMFALTRFAPSPTGYLHLGHVANAIYVWGVARAVGAKVVLRVEDHDRVRCRPEYKRAVLEDLAWLGFTPDLPAPGDERPALRQSDASHAYDEALARLREVAHVYVCDCSRKSLRMRQPALDAQSERYHGFCRSRALRPGPGRGLRVVLPPGSETFDDLRLGAQRQEPALQCGDVLLQDRDGHWTYQFAVVVDDLTQGVDLVIRGEDLLASTGRQIALARLLGRPVPPRFFHHPLILKHSGEKLSKAARDSGVRECRAAGDAPADVIGRAAAAVGLIAVPRPIAATEVGALFSKEDFSSARP